MKRAYRLRKGSPKKCDFVENAALVESFSHTGVAKSSSINFLNQN